jgi:hypothetical protein
VLDTRCDNRLVRVGQHDAGASTSRKVEQLVDNSGYCDSPFPEQRYCIRIAAKRVALGHGRALNAELGGCSVTCNE